MYIRKYLELTIEYDVNIRQLDKILNMYVYYIKCN